jgi:hypothetical protein
MSNFPPGMNMDRILGDDDESVDLDKGGDSRDRLDEDERIDDTEDDDDDVVVDEGLETD